MIGIVTWPPFCYKGSQVTKSIILVKICYKLLYVIQGVENSFGKVTSWPKLISEFLVAPRVHNIKREYSRLHIAQQQCCL